MSEPDLDPVAALFLEVYALDAADRKQRLARVAADDFSRCTV
jgi:hypothetical protein